MPGQSVPFTCSAKEFSPRDIKVKWLKNSTLVRAEPPHITPELSNSSYRMSSTLQVKLSEDDVRSELTCEVQHRTLAAPLRKTYALHQALRGEAHSPGARAGLSRGSGTSAAGAASLPSSPQRVCGRRAVGRRGGEQDGELHLPRAGLLPGSCDRQMAGERDGDERGEQHAANRDLPGLV